MSVIELSNQLADAIETVGRSVVRVQGRSRPTSGSVVSAEGHVMAISHAVEHDEDIELGLPDGATAQARVVGRDPSTDLALLHTGAAGLQPAPWADLSNTRVGQIVLGVYRPGRTARATFGIVGAFGESWRTRFGGRIDRYLEVSLPLQPGFSGGLLADASGHALALSTSGLVHGIALGVPASTVQRVTAALLAHGRVRRGYLGIGSQPVALSEPLPAGLAQGAGLLVVSVQAGGPAARAGVLLGDVVVTLDERTVTSPLHLLEALDEERVGQPARLRVVRAGELRELEVTIGERGDE